MDSKLEAHIDEIFQDVPKTDKMVTMINRIKSKANSKYLETREQGYSRSVAFNEVDDWLMKAKVIVDEEAGKLTPAEIAAAPMVAPAYVDEPAGDVVSSASTDDGEEAVVVERDPNGEASFNTFDYNAPSTFGEDTPAEEPAAEEAPVEEEDGKKKKKKEKKEKKEKKPKKEEVEEEDIVVPVSPVGKKGKIAGIVLLVAGAALLIVAALMVVGII